jgi:hypothetical protein
VSLSLEGTTKMAGRSYKEKTKQNELNKSYLKLRTKDKTKTKANKIE